MNKYYIGWSLPEIYRKSFTFAQELVKGCLLPDTKLSSEDELHITSLYIGEAKTSFALDLMNALHGATVKTGFDGVEVFTNRKGPHCLVVKMTDPFKELLSAHQVLCRASGIAPSFKYNPHVTLAKCDQYPDFGLRRAADILNLDYPLKGGDFKVETAVLYEKPEGGHYAPYMVVGR